MFKTNYLLYTIAELLKLLITTILLPFMLLALIWIMFLGIHEGIWHSKGRETKTK